MSSHGGTGSIRTLTREDIPGVVALYKTVFGAAERSGAGDLESYFDKVFFPSPWYDEDLCSLVYLGSHGRILGFLGLQPRRMSMSGRSLRVAVATKFMVAPYCDDRLAAVRLLRTLFAGPQDLLMTGLSSDAMRRIWERLGGTTALAYSLSWTRLLRPTWHVMSWVGRRLGLKPLALVGRPFCAAADAVAARMAPNRFDQGEPGYTAEDSEAATVVTHLPDFYPRRALRPDYEERSLRWLLEVAGENNPTNDLRRRLVRNSQREVVGWFLYFLEPGGESEVLQMAARQDSVGPVLQVLLADAWREGSVTLSGRLEPHFLPQLSSRHCYFSQNGLWMLIHSKKRDVLNTILSGDAFISRLEGEW